MKVIANRLHQALWVLACTMLLTMAPPTALADGLAVATHVDFDDDTPGQPPSTGGPNRPTSLVSNPGTSILVQENANGIATQPVVLTTEAGGQYVSVDTAFAPVSEGLVRVEATVAFDEYAEGYFLQTSVGTTTAVVTRLTVTGDGDIQSNLTGVTVGAYVPDVPFRVRMDIDMTAHVWSVVIDADMDGFDGDPVTTGLPFENDVEDLPHVGAVGASLQRTFSLSGPVSVAYDDIEVWVDTITVGIDLTPGSSPTPINPRSRRLIPVTIPSTGSFDATSVNPTTVRFGATGTEAAPRDWELRDADGDGDVDLVLRFWTDETGIECGDTSATMTGATSSGVRIVGSVAIRTVGC